LNQSEIRLSMGQSNFFQQSDGLVKVTADLYNVPDGDHGLHVHIYGDLTDKLAGNSAGGHYAGLGSSNHSCPPSPNRHEGDMGNWTATGGRISTSKVFDLLTLQGFYSIVGRAVLLHQLHDDCTGATGNAGGRLSQGVVGIQNLNLEADSEFTQVIAAVATLSHTSSSNSSVNGTVWFASINGTSIRVTAKIQGLTVGSIHGFHIHQYGDLSNITGSSVGDHYNPEGVTHALPPNDPRHVGDLGNLQTYDSAGYGWYQYETSYLLPFPQILGRAVVVHSGLDHGQGYGCTGDAGAAGSRILFGVIGVTDADRTPPIPVSIDNNWKNVPCLSEPTIDINFNFRGMIPSQKGCDCQQ